ncbi:MAG: hypothetical protein CSA95_05025 [Bacteroidetes bacterium]|nr:MAG: hypothetical protein CSA95_05025 [Bacteroidota bacterium]
MIIKFFKNTYPLQIGLILLVSLVLWIPAGIWPREPYLVINNAQPLYNLLIKGHFLTNYTINTILSLLLVLGEAYLVNKLVNRFDLISKTTCLPAFLYILAMGFHPEGLTIHPTLIANLFLLLITHNLFYLNDEQGEQQAVLSIGFYLGMGSLFYFPIIFLLPILCIIIPTISIRMIKDTLIFFMGIFLPYYFLIFAYFLLDKLPAIPTYYTPLLHTLFSGFSGHRALDYVAAAFITVIFLLSILKTTRSLFETVIKTRRKIIFLLLLTLGLTAGLGLSSHPFSDGIMIFFPITIPIIGSALTNVKSSLLADFMLLFFVAFLIIYRVF